MSPRKVVISGATIQPCVELLLKRFMFCLFCLIAVSASTLKAGTAQIIRDVVYDQSIGAAGVGDLYFPDGYTADTPVALAIHGGSWSGGDRYSWSGVADFLCNDLGFIVFNIEYRLTGVASWPACGNDCISAANYLLSSSFTQQYGINCEKVWPCGGSSGGHLALWTGVNLAPENVGGIISISGIGDLIPDEALNPSRYVGLFGHTPSEAELIAASPMTLVSSATPPVICTHAEVDTVVPPECTQHFVDACQSNGVSVVHYSYEQRDTGHSIWIDGSDPHKLFADIESAIAKFVWDITGTNVVVAHDAFYGELNIAEDTLLARPLIDNAVRKSGSAAATLVNPRMSRSKMDVVEGGVRVVASDTFAIPDLPAELQSKAVFWVDANTNVVADGSGVVSRWHDVREASVDGPYSYMMATNSDASRQPTVVPDAALGGKKYMDFGTWGSTSSRWLFWADSGGLARSLSLRSIFIVFGSHNGSGLGGGITLIQNATSLPGTQPTAPFAAKSDRLWYYPSANVVADDGPNYLDRVQQNGHLLQVSGAAYHLLETFTLNSSTAIAGNFANDRSFPQYSGGSRICEAIFFTEELSGEERLQVQEYLWHKWLSRSGESSLGSFGLCNGTSLELEAGTNDLQLTVSGCGTVAKNGSGTVALMNGGDNSFDGTVRLHEGNLLVGGETFLFDIEEGGQTIYAQDINVNRSSAAAGTVVKTGGGELAVASVDASVTGISVTEGTLRLAAPPVNVPLTSTNGVVNEHNLEIFTVGTTLPWLNFTPLGTGVTTVNGWRFDRTAYTVSGNFLIGIAFDYDRSNRVMDIDSAPEGHAVLYINRGKVETDFTVPASGFYRLTFQAGARPGNLNRHVEIQLDGVTIQTIITPTSTFWQYAFQLPFLSSGSHTIGFEGIGETDPMDYGRVALVDDIKVVPVELCEEAPVIAVITNGGFEMPLSMIEAGTVAINEPAGTGWTYSGSAGLGRIQSLTLSERKMPVAVPEGIGVAFLPVTGTISQEVSFPTSGVYRLSFDMAARLGMVDHSFNVTLDGEVIYSKTTKDCVFRQVDLVLPPVTNACVKELSFVGTGSTEQCSLFDNVRIERIDKSSPLGILQNPGFESVYVSGAYHAPSNWVCTSLVYAFSYEFPWYESVPYGFYFGAMAMTDAFYQDVTFPAGGSYALRLLTKTRYAYAPAEYHDFEITLDGERVAHIYNMGDEVREYEVPLPPVTAGLPYRLRFHGLQSYASSGTVSIFDQIAIVPVAPDRTRQSVAGRFPETMLLEVDTGATLDLDFDGQIQVDEVRYDGHVVSGVISAATCPDFVSGSGSIYSAARGTMILLR